MKVGRVGGWRNGVRHKGTNRLLKAVFVLVFLCCALRGAHGQAMPTASRMGDLQFGGGIALGTSTYNFNKANLVGETGYVALDIRKHWGAEFDFHNVKDSGDSTVYERTFEVGPRYHVTRGPFVPYAKLMYGRGIYNFHNSVANIAYNVFTGGGGVDWQVLRSWNVRGDYEYQTWPGFPLNTLHPQIVTIGIAFHFHQ